MHAWRIWPVLILMLFLGGGGVRLPTPEASGELVIATLMSPTTYYLDANDHETGYEYDLLKRFADRQGWQARFLVVRSLTELFDAVRSGRAHLAAAGLAITEQRRRSLNFGPVYDHTTEWVVCRQPGRQPANAAEMTGLRLEVSAGSSHAEHLAALRAQVAGLHWVEVESADTEELFDRVEIGLTDCTVADTDALDLGRNFHPNIKPVFELAADQPQGWLLGQLFIASLADRLDSFFRHDVSARLQAELHERYFGHLNRLSDADIVGILEKRSSLLPQLRMQFVSAQGDTGLDWRLLAAVAYQESQWDANAISPTGVRGIMMLTESTADAMGVKNRLDAKESIQAGARYLAQLKAQIDPGVAEPDRTWMALAAYNIGPSHFEDARRLAKKLGKDPTRWGAIKAVIHMLAQPARAESLRYGYARGGEARVFAENVRIYYDILKRFEPPV